MNHQLIKKIIGVTAILTGFATIFSCEPDDICEPKQAPMVSVKMLYPDTEVEQQEDTIYYRAYINDSVLIGQGNFRNASTFNLPIQISNGNKIKYALQQGSNYSFISGTDTINRIAKIDTIEVNYTIDNKYDSKACGFGVYFKDATFNQISNNWITNIETVNNTIDNATTTNIYIFANPRSN